MTTWQDVRAALVATLNEASEQVGNDAALVVDEWPPESGELASPYAYVLPPARIVNDGANGMVREILEPVVVRFLLDDESARLAAQRMELWIEECKRRVGTNIVPASDATGAGYIRNRRFSAFSTFGPDGRPPYGFEMHLEVETQYVETTRAA